MLPLLLILLLALQSIPSAIQGTNDSTVQNLIIDVKAGSANAEFIVDQAKTGDHNERKSSSISNASSGAKGVLVEVDDVQLQELGSSIVKEEDEFDIVFEIFPLPLQAFWDNFLSDDAKFGFTEYFTEKKEKDISITKWEPDNSDHENQINNCEEIKGEGPLVEGVAQEPIRQLENQLVKFKREMNMIAAIKGVPFWSSSKWNRLTKVSKSLTKIEYISELRTPDVPYGDYFYLQERWVIGSTVPNGNKIYFKVFLSAKIVKETYFKKKIEAR